MRVAGFRQVQVLLAFACAFLAPVGFCFANPAPGLPGQGPTITGIPPSTSSLIQPDVDVYLKGPDGAPLKVSAVVTLIKLNGQAFDQQTTKNGHVRFNNVNRNEYTVLVDAPAYQQATKRVDAVADTKPLYKVTIDLKPVSDAEDAESARSLFALNPKAQKEVGKALDALRSNKLDEARKHLESAQKFSPQSTEIDYLFGVYASQASDPAQADSYWKKTLELDPKHLRALLAISVQLLHDKNPADALPYLNRAIEAEPASWRAHSLLAQALVSQGQNDEAIQHAQRAIDLGHEEASSTKLVLARALLAKGDEESAIRTLDQYVQSNPADKETAKYLERLKHPGESSADAKAPGELAGAKVAAASLPVPSNWLPPDIDEHVPPADASSACQLNDVVQKAGEQIMELVHNVDRFTATESLTHVSFDKYGLPAPAEKRKFNYLVSIQELQHRYLDVEEFRDQHGVPAEFPGGVATNGLPALVLIFHPFNAGNFQMACEGLAQTSTGSAWQIHFRQRPEKPNTIRHYQIGVNGPSYAVALKGRAWISADTYQIVRLETDLVAPIPQIRLMADHTEIEYGPVKFRDGKVNMWLPQSADVYYDWKGRRIHRRHSFSQYLLFEVEDKQKISVPKVDETEGSAGPREQKEQP
jgi:tetratricopeptide (TPR) repeat protein